MCNVQQELVKEMVDADIELMRNNPNAWALTLAAHLHTMDLCVPEKKQVSLFFFIVIIIVIIIFPVTPSCREFL